MFEFRCSQSCGDKLAGIRSRRLTDQNCVYQLPIAPDSAGQGVLLQQQSLDLIPPDSPLPELVTYSFFYHSNYYPIRAGASENRIVQLLKAEGAERLLYRV